MIDVHFKPDLADAGLCVNTRKTFIDLSKTFLDLSLCWL